MLVYNGEVTFLTRVRAGVSQAEQAEYLGLSRYSYRKLELLEDKVVKRRVSKYECLLLLRRRSGWTIAELSAELGCSPFWYRELEKKVHPDVEELLCELTPEFP